MSFDQTHSHSLNTDFAQEWLAVCSTEDKNMSRKKHGGTVTAEMSVIRNECDIEVEVSGYYEPAQDGGWDEPSWSANVQFEEAQDMHGNPFELTPDEIIHAEELMLESA